MKFGCLTYFEWSVFDWGARFAVYVAFEEAAHALDFFGVFSVEVFGLAGVGLEIE